MGSYSAPVREQEFALETSGQLGRLAGLARFSQLGGDLVEPVLASAAAFAEQVLAPLNRTGDKEGARLVDGTVRLASGFAEAYRQYVEGGWTGLAAPAEWGGQDLPFVLGCAVQEQVTSANIAFALCPMLTQGAIEALGAHGSAEQKARYLPRLVSGEWSGTMNLTEPQAGSDVGAIRTLARPHADGTWRIEGTKIFITWGDHEAAENIVHLVLARLPDAPAGTRGISLFLVPKFLPDGTRNDVRCVSLEHKLGLHGSPTCVMSFGDDGACVGWLVGEANGGMRAMFTMMNHARINVGLQGVAIAERAWQGALAYARERVQSGPLLGHADVRRMLLSMKARTEAARALVYHTASMIDRAHGEPDAEARATAKGLADLLTPVAKAWATDIGVQVASDAIQVFGGMGFIEETGAAQHLRDSRILPIYEGTNGIQAIDLVGRKLQLDGGRPWRDLLAMIRAEIAALDGHGDCRDLAGPLSGAAELAEAAAAALRARDREEALAAATPFAELVGLVVAAYLLARQARAASDRLAAGENATFHRAKMRTVRFFFENLLPHAGAWAGAVRADAAGGVAIDEQQLASGWS